MLAGGLLLGACGFTPAYGPGGAATALRDRIALFTPDDLPGFALRNALADRLGDNPGGSYALAVTLTQNQTAAAIDSDGVTTRVTLVGEATWTLTDRATGATLGTGAVDNFTAYFATGTTVATEAAARDASDRLAVILADTITADLILLASDLP